MRLIGTVAGTPTSRQVKTKEQGLKTLNVCPVLDADGGIVTVQEWLEEGKNGNSFADLKTGDKVNLIIQNPSKYQGVTQATYVGPTPK